jgi:myosin heavy subunit
LEGEDAINPGVFWLSNVQEMLSFVCVAESELLAPVATSEMDDLEWQEYDRLVSVVKHDLESLQFNIYHTWMKQLKTRLHKMIIPAVIESQSLPGFITNDGNRFLNKLLQSSSGPQFSMDDLINLLNKVYKAMKAYYLEETIIQQAAQALLKLVGVTAFNDLLMRYVAFSFYMLIVGETSYHGNEDFKSITTLLELKNGARVTTCPKVLFSSSICNKRPSCFNSRRRLLPISKLSLISAGC